MIDMAVTVVKGFIKAELDFNLIVMVHLENTTALQLQVVPG